MTESPRLLWAQLRKAELEEYLGDELLDRLRTILPAISPVTGLTVDQLHQTSSLAQLFDAFVASEALLDRGFREHVLNSCREEQLDRLLAELGEEPDAYRTFDEKVESIGSQKWTRAGLAHAFVEVFQLPARFLPPRVAKVPSREVLAPVPTPLKRLKDFQFDVFSRAWGKLEPNNGRVVVQMPTGSGKTRTAMELIAAFFEGGLSAKSRVVWLAHSSELCDQAADAFREVWGHYATMEVALHRSWGSSRGIPGPDETGWMWVTSLQMAHSLSSKGEIPKADLIVVDEAHKVLAPTYEQAIRELMTTNTRVLGLTATPGRGASLEEENRALAEFFFNTKVTIEPGDDTAIEYLRKRKVLALLEREVLETGAEVHVTSRDAASALDVPSKVLDQLSRDDLRSAEIATRLTELASEGRSCLVFATSVGHSKFLAALLTFMGVSAAHLDGTSRSEERSFMIEQFRSGEIRVLCNFGVLTTGFDAPKIDVLCIARPTTSIVLYSQMLGRGLRGPAIGGTERCQVIDVKDNIIGIPELDELYEWFDEYYGA